MPLYAESFIPAERNAIFWDMDYPPVGRRIFVFRDGETHVHPPADGGGWEHGTKLNWVDALDLLEKIRAENVTSVRRTKKGQQQFLWRLNQATLIVKEKKYTPPT